MIAMVVVVVDMPTVYCVGYYIYLKQNVLLYNFDRFLSVADSLDQEWQRIEFYISWG